MIEPWENAPREFDFYTGFDPLGFASKGDLRSEEVIVGRIAMLGIAGMVAQELNTAGYLFYPDTY